MASSIRYPSNTWSFFSDQEIFSEEWLSGADTSDPRDLHLNRILININISKGAMYPPETSSLPRFSWLHALAAGRIPDHEHIRLQNFLKGIKVTTPYRAHHPNRQRFVK